MDNYSEERSNEDILILEPPQTCFTGDNNFTCGFCSPIVVIK